LVAAASAIDRAIALDPRAQLPRLRKALLALRRDQPTAAVVELESLVERNPSYLPAWRNLVVAYDRAGDREGVARSLTRGLALFPNDVPLLTHQVVVLRNQGRPEDALLVLRRALVVAPTDPTLLLREVFLLGELGRPEEARLAAQRGLALDPPAAIRERLQALLR
jgi:Flp pilus assembly protein TadD